MRTIAAGLALSLLLVAHAHADGLPVTAVDAGPIGLPTADERDRFLALPAGPGTVIAQSDPKTGSVGRSIYVPEKLTIPAVALDGSATGLSRDGDVLVLIRPRRTFPQETTRLAIVDTKKLKLRRRITLKGDFSFDALSPDGKTAFLIHYVSRRDYTKYRVRAYDLAANRLLPGEIADPDEPAEAMAGWPITRAYSDDGRWAYTLYAGTEEHAFVHALDTVGRQAICIDLHDLSDLRTDRLYALKLKFTGAALEVRDDESALVTIDAETHEVGAPAAARTAPPPKESGLALWPGFAGALALLGVGLAVRRRRAP